MFTKESMDESNMKEFKKIGKQLKDKNEEIEELNMKIMQLENDATKNSISTDSENVCNKCNCIQNSATSLKLRMNKEHNYHCNVCEYITTTKKSLNQHIRKEHD